MYRSLAIVARTNGPDQVVVVERVMSASDCVIVR
jgi:hypothetical protein